MESLEKLLNNYINLDFDQVFNELILESKDFILQLQKDRLFTIGEDSKGLTLGQYAVSTKIKKQRQGLPSGHITLFDTGEFYNSFTLQITADGFVLNADGQKESINLFERYGNDILGLSFEDFEKFVEFSIEALQRIIYDKLFEGVS